MYNKTVGGGGRVKFNSSRHRYRNRQLVLGASPVNSSFDRPRTQRVGGGKRPYNAPDSGQRVMVDGAVEFVFDDLFALYSG